MRVMIGPGQTLEVSLCDESGEEIDGTIEVKFGAQALTVETTRPDSFGRKGILYEEKFGKVGKNMRPLIKSKRS
jgi:hypothetical protein